MDYDRNTDKLHSEPPPEFTPSPIHDRVGSMNLGSPPNANGGDVSPVNGESLAQTGPPPPPASDPNAQSVDRVVNSEIGVSTLLNRLKQSIASANDFASFLKKRSSLEEQHSSGLKKLCRITADNNRRPEHRHGSYLQAYDQVTTIHERMADNGAQFAISLHQMSDDLTELALNIERGRKHWKATGLAAETRVADTEALMRKSKAKYDGLAEDYDRARTGEKQSATKKFGIKGPKSAAQYEEDTLRKLQAADADYAQKVQAAQVGKAELQSKLRPEAVRAMLDLIKECDSAVTLQMQKFASFNEKLLLSNGLNISPLNGNDGANQRSLREVVYGVDNEKDLSTYLIGFANKVPPKQPDIKYERSSVLSPTGSAPPPANFQKPAETVSSFNSRQGPPSSLNQQQPPPPQQQQQQQSPQNSQPPPFMTQAPPQSGYQPQLGVHERSFSGGGPPPAQFNSGPGGPPSQQGGPPKAGYGSIGSSGPPQLNALPFETSHSPPPPAQQPQQQQYPPQQPYSNYNSPPPAAATNNQHLPPLKPVFGLSLDQLFERDGHAVPPIVSQCIQAVDLFGLDQEGIYRLSGTASHIQKIKAMFDNDASKVDFRNPENFMHDVNSVAGLLKQFFRDLPDPLLTAEHYAGFIDAAKHDDDTTRRDSLHAIINALPDPNYATLRAITLHLHRVVQNSSANRMNASNLAIVFGPTLMGANTGPDIQDAGWQVRCIDTILVNCYQIFDDD